LFDFLVLILLLRKIKKIIHIDKIPDKTSDTLVKKYLSNQLYQQGRELLERQTILISKLRATQK
jgi:hypothetical protein